MDYDYMEKELLEISAFLKLISQTFDNIDKLDVITLALLFADKTEKLYCYLIDSEEA